jgi:hypothetical protein
MRYNCVDSGIRPASYLTITFASYARLKYLYFLTITKNSCYCKHEFYSLKWWAMTGSNCRHPACKAGALPAELIARIIMVTRGGIEPPLSP